MNPGNDNNRTVWTGAFVWRRHWWLVLSWSVVAGCRFASAALLRWSVNFGQPRQQLLHLARQLWRFNVSRHYPNATPQLIHEEGGWDSWFSVFTLHNKKQQVGALVPGKLMNSWAQAGERWPRSAYCIVMANARSVTAPNKWHPDSERTGCHPIWPL
jgi:hypothetical protein